MKTSKEPLRVEIKANNMDHKDYTEGRLVYFFSERRTLGPEDSNWRKKLIEDGYHLVKHQQMRNGKMIYVRNAKVVVEVYEYRSHRVRVYDTDITNQLGKLVGARSASPESIYQLKKLIDYRKINVILSDGEVTVVKN